ncbi:hypothetical protein [Burkholderia glumae]|uniref:hypothetical protein n=1 Tax=Burkholderia glumae TaxID=337 RepID=UPI00215019D3|nr:hypothetical protein [Burkholderia glumae]UVS95692.1 hypothetical protein EFP19_07840 [Burkholderia glumae]
MNFIRKWRERRQAIERDREALHRYRVHLGEYDRWLSEFPDICRVLENLKGESEYEGRPGTVDICLLRNEIREMRRARTTTEDGNGRI